MSTALHNMGAHPGSQKKEEIPILILLIIDLQNKRGEHSYQIKHEEDL